MNTAKVALRPENEAPRTTRWQGRRGTTNYFNYSDDVDSLTEQRVQRLVRTQGLPRPRAALIATLVWGAAA